MQLIRIAKLFSGVIKRGYFSNKRCKYCRAPASIYRSIGKGWYVFLCKSMSCDRKSKVEAGLVNGIDVAKVKTN